MTASERLQELSGLAGVTAAAMLLAIGSGTTAGSILVSRSALGSGSAAAHLLDVGIVAPPVESSGGGWVGPHFRYRPKDEGETLLLLGIL